MAVRPEYFPFVGGLNLVDPAMSINPGQLLVGINYEAATRGGYRRVDGYERYDGRSSPTDATYVRLNFDAGQNAPSTGSCSGSSTRPGACLVNGDTWTNGDTITGGTSAATGILLKVTVTSGSWAGNDAAGELVLTNVSGTFQDNETLSVGATTIATSNGTASVATSADSDYSTMVQDSIESARNLISAVPGSGDIRGVWQYSDNVYAFRDNAGATACVMYKATTSGWSSVDLGQVLNFDAGSTEIAVGATVTGASSGATSVVKAIKVSSGTWAGSDAAGTLYIKTVSGTYTNNENLQVSAATYAVADGSNSALTIAAGGRYDFVNYNFSGHSSTLKMYGCGGQDHAFEYDGTDYAPIITAMTTDTPDHIAAHKKHLFLTFSGGSLQHSAIGDPTSWELNVGSGELTTGSDITSLKVLTNDVLAVFSQSSIWLLYGTSSDDWSMKEFSSESGAKEWTVVELGDDLLYLNDLGLTGLQATQSYGDFNSATYSQLVKSYIDSHKTLVTASVVSKEKNQVRIFFSDDTGLIATFDGNSLVGFTRIDTEHSIKTIINGGLSSDALYFGSDNGFVYQMDKGTSFDGKPVLSFCRLAFNHFRSPSQKKRFRKLTLELDSPDQVTLNYMMDLDYSKSTNPNPIKHSTTVSSGGAWWDATLWNNFNWGLDAVASAEANLVGTGTNMSILIYHTGTYDSPFTLEGAIIHYTPRGLKR